MPEDIKVSIGVDDSALSAAIARIKNKLKELDPAAVERGRATTAAFAKMGLPVGQAFKLMSEKDKADVAQYHASLTQIREATREVGEESRRTGINLGNMFERMIVRAGIAITVFGTIRLAIKGVTDAAKEVTAFDMIQQRFSALTSSANTVVSD
jgi:erythromycin esterase-like protein